MRDVTKPTMVRLRVVASFEIEQYGEERAWLSHPDFTDKQTITSTYRFYALLIHDRRDLLPTTFKNFSPEISNELRCDLNRLAARC